MSAYGHLSPSQFVAPGKVTSMSLAKIGKLETIERPDETVQEYAATPDARHQNLTYHREHFSRLKSKPLSVSRDSRGNPAMLGDGMHRYMVAAERGLIRLPVKYVS
jgi:hypothetical protein